MTTPDSSTPEPSLAMRIAHLDRLAQTAQQLAETAQGTQEAEVATVIATTLRNTVNLMQQGLTAEDEIDRLLLVLLGASQLDVTLPHLDEPT